MARTVDVAPGEVVVRLTGWTAVAAMRREIRIPRSAIRTVSTGPWTDDGWRVAGTAIPFRDYRQGRFRRRGERRFLTFERRDRLLILRVDGQEGVGFDVPEGVAALLAA